MAIYLLKNHSKFNDFNIKNRGKGNPWNPWYDKNFTIVVVAKSEEEARQIAADMSADEGDKAWLDSTYSLCEIIDPNGESRTVCIDHRQA